MSDKTQRRGLGRGLGSLIPTAPREETGAVATAEPPVPGQPSAEAASADWIGVPLPGDGEDGTGGTAQHEDLQPVTGARFASTVSPSDFSDFLNARLTHEWITRAGKAAVRSRPPLWSASYTTGRCPSFISS